MGPRMRRRMTEPIKRTRQEAGSYFPPSSLRAAAAALSDIHAAVNRISSCALSASRYSLAASSSSL